jgi:micrococcal nuclease
MIASKAVRLVSLAVVALVVALGVRGVVNGFAVQGDVLGAGPARGGAERTAAVVSYVLDGDTVQVTTRSGTSVRVRFLGISAPEIPHPGKAGECYGYPATRHLKRLLPAGTHVTLISDPTQDDTDVYGRSLRYVQAGGRDIGAAQIRAGAASARASSTPVSRHSTYVGLEHYAQDQHLGMWSACP